MLTKTQWRINAPLQKMFKFNDRGAFGEAKRKVSLMIEEVRQESSEDADYLEEHMVFDDETLTFRYTGDDRFAMLPEESLN
jgi:hypothetical protein